MASPAKLDERFFAVASSRATRSRRGQNLRLRRSALRMVLAVMVSILVVSLPAILFAQSSSTPQNPPAEPEGVSSGGYLIHSSVELGYRFNSVTGSGAMYDTLVNQQTGPRFLDQTLSMQSQDHQGLLFDDLSINSFGWGGDPNNALRLRVDKNKWYNLQGSFRRDQNFSDYDLLANPLNPPTSTPSIPVLNSPHEFATTRRMTRHRPHFASPVPGELSPGLFA